MADEPIEYLTEIRQVTVLFINCKINVADIKSAQVIDAADKAFLAVSKYVERKLQHVFLIYLFILTLLGWLKISMAVSTS